MQGKQKKILSASLLLLLLFLIALRFYFQGTIPVLGDEAYYFYWGHHFAGGFYDLPPMIGWWERALSWFSDHRLWLRLPNAIVFFTVVYWMRKWLMRSLTTAKATATSLLYLFSPIPFFAVIISHEVTLTLFLFFSAWFFYQGSQKTGTKKAFFISGLLWGGAFLSKYFAVFVLPFYLILFFYRKGKNQISKFAMFTLGALPFVLEHLIWNSQHCWANFVFNLITRQQVDEGPFYKTTGMYLLYLALLVTPVLWKPLFKTFKERWFKPKSQLEAFFLGMWSVPASVFLMTALLGRGQGLHWMLPFMPFFFLWFGLRFPLSALQRSLKQMMLFTYAISLVVLTIVFFPQKTLAKYFQTFYPLEYQIAWNGAEYAEKVASELNTSLWGETDLVVADGYSQASVLDHELRNYFGSSLLRSSKMVPPVGVWGGGTRFGRVFDWTVQWEKFEGKNVAFVSKTLMPAANWGQYFKESRVSQKELKGKKFWLYMGHGFYAHRYLAEVMKPAWKKHYPKFFLEDYLPSRCELRD